MKKFLSLILAVTLVTSLFTVNVMASNAHTATVTVTKADGSEATGLVAGDKVIVEITVDGTAGLLALGYWLEYDADAFSVDLTMGEYYENYIDEDWYFDYIENTRGSYKGWAQTMATTKNANDAGFLKYSWFSSTGGVVANDYTDFIIGKFNFTVKDGAEGGDYSFALRNNIDNSYTSDDGQNMMLLTSNTATAKVEGAAPAGPSVGAAADYDEVKNGETVYDNAVKVGASIQNLTGATEVGFEFIPAAIKTKDGNWNRAAKASLTTGIGEGYTEFRAVLVGIPADLFRAATNKTVTILSRAFATVGTETTYGTEESTLVSFE